MATGACSGTRPQEVLATARTDLQMQLDLATLLRRQSARLVGRLQRQDLGAAERRLGVAGRSRRDPGHPSEHEQAGDRQRQIRKTTAPAATYSKAIRHRHNHPGRTGLPIDRFRFRHGTKCGGVKKALTGNGLFRKQSNRTGEAIVSHIQPAASFQISSQSAQPVCERFHSWMNGTGAGSAGVLRTASRRALAAGPIPGRGERLDESGAVCRDSHHAPWLAIDRQRSSMAVNVSPMDA